MRIPIGIAAAALLFVAIWPTQEARGQDEARIRVAHASPDAPAVDILVDDMVALDGVAYRQVTEYAVLPAGSHNIKVVPAGQTEPVVIEADLDLTAGTDTTVAALGALAEIQPLVLTDDNAAPEAGKAHVRFVHASPDAPAVDVFVKNGPVLFADVAFGEVGAYVPVDADVYDIEVRVAGSDTVALDVSSLVLRDGNVYTVFAMGLVGGDPTLEAVVSTDRNPARVRVAHASPDAPAVDILVDDAVAFGNVAFNEVSAYAALPEGTVTVKVVPTGMTEPVVLEADLEVMAGMDYTVTAVGLLADIDLLVLEDDNGMPDPGTAHVRFVHASPDAPAVDVAVSDGPVLFANVSFGEVGDYEIVPAGAYDLEVRPTGTMTVALALPDIALEAGTVYTAFATGLLAGDPALGAVLTVDARFSMPEPPSDPARVRVAHASPDAPAVDVWVDDEVALSGLAFGQVSEYAPVPSGTRNVKVVPAGATEPVVIDVDVDLEPDTDYTVAATGLLASIQPLLLVDDNSAPDPETVHVRFVHASPDAPPVDVAVTDGPVLFEGVAFGEAAGPLPVDPNVYDLEVRAAGTTTVALELPGVLLRDGNVYTVFAMGLLGGDPALEAVIAVDRNPARVRVAHASPDAPAVDILIDDSVAIDNVAFGQVSSYSALDAGMVNVKVVPAGASEPVVIEADLELAPGADYTVAAIGLLAEIQPLVLQDDNGVPVAGTAHVRFVHASPDAPPVDIALKDGDVLFPAVGFGEASQYVPADADTYDLEVRLAGTSTVVLEIPGVALEAGTVYTVFAMGLVAGDPPVGAVPVVDAAYDVPVRDEGAMIYLPFASRGATVSSMAP